MVARTPLGRVRGLGAARSGTEHFWRERLTSAALIPLTIYFLGIMVALVGADYDTVVDTLGSPLVAVPMMLFAIVTAWHMKLGMQVVIEDYVHGHATKLTALVLNAFFCFLVAAVAVYALLQLSLGD